MSNEPYTGDEELQDATERSDRVLVAAVEALREFPGITAERKRRTLNLTVDNGSDPRLVVTVRRRPHGPTSDYIEHLIVLAEALTSPAPSGVHGVPPPRCRGASFAAQLAGRRRLHLRNEWASLLAGEDGRGLPAHRRFVLVAGFLLAALRMRARDLLGFLWSPVDWLLSTEARSNGANTMVVGSLVVYIQATDGVHTLLTEGWAWCAGCGVAVRMLIAWLRRVRGVELATAARSSGDGE